MSISDLVRVWPGVAARLRACGSCWGAALVLLLLAPSSCAGLTLPDPRKGSAECGHAGLSHVCDPGKYLGAAAAKSVEALAAQLESSGSIVTAAVVVVIESMKEIFAIPKLIPPINPDKPIPTKL